MTEGSTGVDILARFAQAWDCAGNNVFWPPLEPAALATLAGLENRWRRPWSHVRWNDLNVEERRKLLHAARRLIDMARVCAWVFGAE